MSNILYFIDNNYYLKQYLIRTKTKGHEKTYSIT